MARHARPLKNITRTKSRRNACSTRPFITLAQVRFAEAANAYIMNGGEGRYLGSPLLKRIGKLYLSQIDQCLIDEIAEELWTGKARSTQTRRCHTVISAVLKFSASRGWCASWRIARPRHVAQRIELPNDDDQKLFIANCSPHFRNIVIFMRCTGASAREVIRLHWSNVDLSARTATLTTPKRRSRLVHFDEAVAARLARLRHRSGAVFLNQNGRPYKQKRLGGGEFKTARNGAAERASVARIGPRILRKIWHQQQILGSDSHE